jgi:hypothetical protein
MGDRDCPKDSRGCEILRVIKVNTLEPLLKTLTPQQSLTRQGFQRSQVKFYGSLGEQLQDDQVMGFGDGGEGLRDSE